MKNLLKSSITFTLLIIFFIFQVSAASGDTVVYVTNTGEKYHSYGCQYLRKSCNSISLSNAVSAGYTRCSRCSPPYLDVSTPQATTSDVIQEAKVRVSTGTTANDTGEAETAKLKRKIASLESKIEYYKSNWVSTDEMDIKISDVISEYQEMIEAKTEEYETAKMHHRTSSFWYIVIASGSALWLGYVLTSIFANRKIDKLEKLLSEVSSDYNDLRQKTELRDQYIEEYAGKTCRELAQVPEGVTFGTDHWPVGINGKSLVVFLSANKKKYHAYGCRYFDSYSAVNVYQIPKGCEPCKVCHPIEVSGTPAWMFNYQSYIETKREHHIPDPDLPYPVD